MGLRWPRALVVHSGCGAVGVVWVPPLLLLWRGQLTVGLRLEGPEAWRRWVLFGRKGPGALRGGVHVLQWRLGRQRVRGEGWVRRTEHRGQS